MSINPLKPLINVPSIIKRGSVEKSDKDKKKKDKKEENNQGKERKIDIRV